MPRPMPDPICVPDTPWRLSPRRTGLADAWASSWRVLRRLLLGNDGAVACGRRDEPALDCRTRVTHFLGEDRSFGAPDRPPCWHSPHRGGSVVVGNGNVLTARI